MTKYLDSKGLSYLWQKIKAELALKSDNHEHPYVKDDTVIKLGSDDATGISLVKASVEGQKDSWTIPFATVETVTKEYDGQPVTESHIKNGIVRSGDITFGVPTSADTTWHKAPIVDGYVWYENTLADANTVTAAADLTENQIVLGAGTKGIKVNGNTISSTFGATTASTTAVPTESAVAGYVTASSFAIEDKTIGEGEEAKTSKYLVLRDKYNAEIASIDATDFLVDGMLDKVEYKTVERELEGGAKETVTTDILVLTWNTDAGKQAVEVDLGKYIDVYTAGSGISITDHEISVKTTGIDADATPNVSTGVNAEGNIVGYVDLSAYQKSEDLVAFDKNDMDAIFAAAEADLTTNKGVPTFPTADPLVKEEPAQPEA